jgi:hypothetical protein
MAKQRIAKQRILAIGAGAQKDKKVEHKNDATSDIDVRAYVAGLIDGLAQTVKPDGTLYDYQIGTDYDIWYRHCDHTNIPPGAFNKGGDGTPNNLIFPMSLPVLNAAIATNQPQNIIFPSVSQTISNIPQNVAGINAQRSQAGLAYLTAFLQTVPALQPSSIGLMTCDGYPPSDNAKTAILGKYPSCPRVNVAQTDLATQQSTNAKLDSLAQCKGLLVLPIDFCFAAAPFIINGIQQRQAGNQAGRIPTFLPIPDWVQPATYWTGPAAQQAPAFGGYGISQYSCGFMAAGLIAQIWNGATPSGLGVQTAINFTWLVSQSAATALNITLPTYLPALGAQVVT